jgi:hypothetical protein
MDPGVFAVMLSSTHDARHTPSLSRESVTGSEYVMMKHFEEEAPGDAAREAIFAVGSRVADNARRERTNQKRLLAAARCEGWSKFEE